MIPITIINLFVLMLLYMSYRLKLKRSLMPVCVMILIMFFGVRYNYGNDFAGYERIFNTIRGMSLDRAFGRFNRLEDGWIVLNYLFRETDFQLLIIFLTVIQFCSIGWLVERYVDIKYQWAVMAIYLFLPSMMLTQLSMLRQGLAMQIIVFSLYFLFEKRKMWWVSVLMLILAVQFHKSAYAALPILLLPLCVKVNYKYIMAVYLALIVVFQCMPEFSLNLITNVLSTDEFDRYDTYMGKNNVTVQTRSGLGYVYQMLLGLYLVYILRWRKTSNRFFILTIGLFYTMLPITGVVGLVARLGYYYYMVGLPGFQELFKRSRRDPVAMLFSAVFIFFAAQNYVKFFYEPIWTKRFLHYTTIFNY